MLFYPKTKHDVMIWHWNHFAVPQMLHTYLGYGDIICMGKDRVKDEILEMVNQPHHGDLTTLSSMGCHLKNHHDQESDTKVAFDFILVQKFHKLLPGFSSEPQAFAEGINRVYTSK